MKAKNKKTWKNILDISKNKELLFNILKELKAVNIKCILCQNKE